MIKPEDLRVDVFSNGHDNPAVRTTHMPTGTVVTCDDHPGQLRNRVEALKQLRAHLGEHEPVDVLGLPVEDHDMTVGEYLILLATGLVDDTVTAKHGFTGSSDWRHDLYGALITAGLVKPGQERKADHLLSAALFDLLRRPA